MSVYWYYCACCACRLRGSGWKNSNVCTAKVLFLKWPFWCYRLCVRSCVESFDCVGRYQLNITSLPDALDEYKKMGKLISINMSGSSLETTPEGWSSLPATHGNGISIDLSNSRSLTKLSFSLCTRTMPLKKIILKGTQYLLI